MGLDAGVYADDEEERCLASVRIGNLANVVYLREAVAKAFPEASVLLTKVLYSAFHSGDTLEIPDLIKAKAELERVLERCENDSTVREFVVAFGGLVETALAHGRPVTFI